MYKITYLDGTTFIGGEPNDSKWDLMPNKPIIKLEYKLFKHQIIFENYDAYNHVVERFVMLRGGLAGICKVILMAKKGSRVLEITYNFRKGKVTQEICEFGKEYRGKPHSGWKPGIIGKPKINII